MQRDRFLIGILAGIGVLILLALILFFIRQGKTGYQEANTPEAVLSDYFLAIQKRDYQRAYNYLADSTHKPDLVHFQEPFVGYQGSEISNVAVEVGAATIDSGGKTAIVPVSVIHTSRDLFSNTYRSQESATMVLQNGTWKVSQAPYPYWGYGWEK